MKRLLTALAAAAACLLTAAVGLGHALPPLPRCDGYCGHANCNSGSCYCDNKYPCVHPEDPGGPADPKVAAAGAGHCHAR